MGPIPFFTLAVPGGYESMYSILRTYSVQFMPKFCFGGLGLTDLRCCCSLGRLFATYPSCVFCNLRIIITTGK